MWKTYQMAKTYGKLPSEVMQVEDSIAAWCLDDAVTWFGITIENALQERVEVTFGKKTQSRQKYTLALLLHQDFRLPTPPPDSLDVKSKMNPFGALLSWAGKRGSPVKRYVYVPPPLEESEVKLN